MPREGWSRQSGARLGAGRGYEGLLRARRPLGRAVPVLGALATGLGSGLCPVTEQAGPQAVAGGDCPR